MTTPPDFLHWPFFEDRHRALAAALEAWATEHAALWQGEDVDAICRRTVRALGEAGWLRHAVAAGPAGLAATRAPRSEGSHGADDAGRNGSGISASAGLSADISADISADTGPDTDPSSAPPGAIDTRAICLIRETLARHGALADFAFAMQGLGSGAIGLAGSTAQRERWLPAVARGEAIAAFALSEPEAGSDVAALACTARIEGDEAVLDGEKTWISNGGIADFYVVFARSGEAPGARGLSAFVVEAGTPGLKIAERIDVIAPHPLARLRFAGCRVPLAQRLGEAGEGFKLAMRTLDIFRTSVAAAALGFGRRALAAALERAAGRRMFGGVLGDFQLTQARLATMATTLDAAALLTYRAAWLRDQGHAVTREAAMAKLAATEGAQQVIDGAVQLWGGLGVVRGQPVEQLYREIRALRIYEGASEVQQLIIGRDLLRHGR